MCGWIDTQEASYLYHSMQNNHMVISQEHAVVLKEGLRIYLVFVMYYEWSDLIDTEPNSNRLPIKFYL